MKNSTQPTYEAIRSEPVSKLIALDNGRLHQITKSIRAESADLQAELRSIEQNHQECFKMLRRANLAHEWMQGVQRIKKSKMLNNSTRLSMVLLPQQTWQKINHMSNKDKMNFTLSVLEVLTEDMGVENGK